MLPAHAGMVPGHVGCMICPFRAPRARGDGPRLREAIAAVRACSPRTWGWSPDAVQDDHASRVLPAPAGMVPAIIWLEDRFVRAPRARGDGPVPLICPDVVLNVSPGGKLPEVLDQVKGGTPPEVTIDVE